MKNLIFEIPVIPQTLNINKQKTESAKSISLDIIGKLIEYFFKKGNVKAVFTPTVLEILLFKDRLKLWLAQWITGSKKVK